MAHRRVFGPGDRHHTLDLYAGFLQAAQLRREPGFVDRRDPAALATGGAGRQREVHGAGVVEQLFFEHAGHGGTHSRRGRLGQLNAVPTDIGIGQHEHHAVGLGQQAGAGAAVLAHGDAVGREHEAELGAEAGRRGRRAHAFSAADQARPGGKLNDQGGHVGRGG